MVLKAMSLFFEAIQYHVIKVYGHHKLSADVPYYFFLSVKGVCLFVVILLIGTGMCSMLRGLRPYKRRHWCQKQNSTCSQKYESVKCKYVKSHISKSRQPDLSFHADVEPLKD